MLNNMSGPPTKVVGIEASGEVCVVDYETVATRSRWPLPAPELALSAPARTEIGCTSVQEALNPEAETCTLSASTQCKWTDMPPHTGQRTFAPKTRKPVALQ
jgi:hypothetical protein